ncbi:YrrS family protein [Bacillus gaemokensis]|uniref:FMN-dependent NADH-azoreductase n=2 Tax=Bacteria TaxID=2 RepID=A0A073K851_9BACI|nr:YrrS family protein [Bacillus gaemokensis]KEK23434.1 FMN-dependent NADH-azoreductase [Bacillus gaemokensis]KYG25824.1 FMN-dependent NADH-azoreductase [Bacillus gaemokensis]
MEHESRFEEKQQRRRQRGVVNIGLSVVLLAVGMISYQLLFTSQTKGKENVAQGKSAQIASKDEKSKKLEEQKIKQAEEEKAKEQDQKETENKKGIEQKNQETETIKANETKQNENKVKEQEKQVEQKNNKIDEQKMNEEKTNKKQEEKNTDQTNQNGQWQPIGTQQGTKPTMQFKEGTTDWNEMKKAISYAVDVPEGQLIYDFIGNNGTNKAYGNVRDKQGKKYKVYIDWVENKGWKPVSVQAVK